MAIPTYKASGAFTASASAVAIPYPTSPNAPVANDIALLVVESENEAITLSTANGFVEVPTWSPQFAGTAATDPASRLAVFWKRCVGGDANPTVADSGNHQTGQIHLFSGCITSGNPWDVGAGGNDGGANDTSGVIPGATTTVVDCLVVLICSTSFNGTSTAQFSGWTNADLGSLTERADNSNTIGLGGGHGMATGTKASIGAYASTTVTLANTSFKGAISLALRPPVAVTYPITMAATAIGVATLTKTATFTRTLPATAVGVADLSLAKVFSKTLAATAVGVATMTESITLGITMAATAVGGASLSLARTLSQTLAGVATGIATLAKEYIAGTGGGAKVYPGNAPSPFGRFPGRYFRRIRTWHHR